VTVNFPWKILCNADTCVETCTCAGRILVTWLVQYLPSCVLEIQTRRGIYWAFHVWKVYSLRYYRTDTCFAYFWSVSVLNISYGSYILQVFPYFKSVMVINILWKSNVVLYNLFIFKCWRLHGIELYKFNFKRCHV
jgi:hypothetical protein